MKAMPITLGRAVLLVVVCALASVGLTFASARDASLKKPARAKPLPPPTKVIPGVVGQAYVFAKSTLQNSGFAWRVEGKTEGYAGNVVRSQSPAAGTVVLDNGYPLVRLRLSKPAGYVPRGSADNVSPYEGTEIAIQDQPSSVADKALVAEQPKATNPIKKATVKTAKPTAKKQAAKPKANERPPAFVSAGAPREPLDEMPLPDRARLLGKWLESHRAPTPANVRYWLYQHAWVVTGARFGWWHGAQALRILISVDERTQALWKMGAKSETEARQALAYVEAKTG
jgi:hypothetical protein